MLNDSVLQGKSQVLQVLLQRSRHILNALEHLTIRCQYIVRKNKNVCIKYEF